MLGKEVRLPAEIAFGSSTTREETISSYGEYVSKLKSKMNFNQYSSTIQVLYMVIRAKILKNYKH